MEGEVMSIRLTFSGRVALTAGINGDIGLNITDDFSARGQSEYRY